MDKRCVAYCRVSTDQADQLHSLEAQKNYFLELFKKDGYNPSKCGVLYTKDGNTEPVQGIYADTGITGTSIKKREAFKQMIADAKMKKFDVIYVKSITRFSRDNETIGILRDLKGLGIDIKFLQEGMSLLDTDEFSIALHLNLSNRESEETSKRVKFGIREQQKKGKSRSPKIYGYIKEDGDFKIYEKEAEVVRKIFNMILEGYGYNKIARTLNEEGIPTKLNRTWRNNTILSIVENPIYFGTVRSHVREIADVNRKTIKKVDEEEVLLIDRPDLAILPKEVGEQVQQALSQRKGLKIHGSKSSHKHLLSNLLKCGNCGSSFRRKKYVYKDGTITYHWSCTFSDSYGLDKCNTRTATREDLFIPQVIEEVKRMQSIDIEGLYTLYVEYKYGDLEDISRVDELKKQRDRLNRKKELFRDDYAEGICTKEEYKENVKGLDNELKQLKVEIEAFDNVAYTLEKTHKAFIDYKKYLNSLDLESMTNVELKKVFKEIRAYTIIVEGKKIKYYAFVPVILDTSLDEIIKKLEEKGHKISFIVTE